MSRLFHWFKELDRILRGDATQLTALRAGLVPIPAGAVSIVLIVLGVIYGLCMGVFALVNRPDPEFRQVLASALKVPALFLLTLLVTFPSLYVFNALVGSRLTALSMVRLLVAAMGVTLAVLASFGPIVAFFAVTTESYPFMSLLNVLIFTVSGVLGLLFLLQTLNRLSIAMKREPPRVEPAPEPVPAPAGDVAEPPLLELPDRDAPGALERLEGHVLGPHVKAVFRVWVVVFAVVGAQMAWVLRPFIGDPTQPFTWFRARQSNFFEAVWRALIDLFR